MVTQGHFKVTSEYCHKVPRSHLQLAARCANNIWKYGNGQLLLYLGYLCGCVCVCVGGGGYVDGGVGVCVCVWGVCREGNSRSWFTHCMCDFKARPKTTLKVPKPFQNRIWTILHGSQYQFLHAATQIINTLLKNNDKANCPRNSKNYIEIWDQVVFNLWIKTVKILKNN